jgi:Lon protease-like protein
VPEIGLFPLGIVLLPGERVPLHIFEPRYKELIGECIDSGSPFGLVLADDDGMRNVGTEARVVEVLQRFSDGRMNVVVEGGQPFRLVELTAGRSFTTGEITPVTDRDDRPTRDEVARCLAAYERVVRAAEAELDELDPAAASLAYAIAARIDLGAEVKQELLEMRSERERVLRLAPLLDEAATALERQRVIGERARSNGHVASPSDV